MITDDDLVSGVTLWSKENVYMLDGPVVLEGGQLEIEAGTVVIAKNKPSQGETGSSGLVISQGAQIIAMGTVSAPIRFQGENIEAFQLEPSTWAGIEIIGSAGFSSGILQYVSIRQAGFSDKDFIGSGLSLKSVDQSTVLDHIEVFSSSGDGIHISGGNANLSYVVVSYVRDDAFDWERGWTGKGIFWYANTFLPSFLVQLPHDPGSYAIEGKSMLVEQDTLISNPQIFHVTLVGQNCPDREGDAKGGLGFLDGSAGSVANSLILHFPDFGLFIEDVPGAEDSYTALLDGDLNIKSNGWYDFGRSSTSIAGDQFIPGAGGLIQPNDSGDDSRDDTLTRYLQDNYNIVLTTGMRKNLIGTCTAIDPRLDANSNYADVPNQILPNDVFFNQFPAQVEKGAFSSDLWITGWTALDQLDSFIRLGEEGYGAYYFAGHRLNHVDTLIVACEELPNLQDSLLFKFPCPPFGYQLGAAHRKGNPRRRRPKSRSEENEYAFIEEWGYQSSDVLGCSSPSFLELTILVLDTVPPVIHPIPDGLGGLTAITEDCDVSWIVHTTIDTVNHLPGNTLFCYTFLAEDYSGNQSELSLKLSIGGMMKTWFADLDMDGFGNPLLSLHANDSIPGYVSNGLDCNDSDPNAFPGGGPALDFSSVDRACDGSAPNYDICTDAFEVKVGAACLLDTLYHNMANPTLFPALDESCLPSNFNDIWLKCILPTSGEIHVSISESLTYFDNDGFGRLFMAEIYSGDCQELQWEYCTTAASSTLVFNFEALPLAGQEIYLRVMEAGNKSDAPFEICILDLVEKVTNDICDSAIGLAVQGIDSCQFIEVSNLGALSSPTPSEPSCQNTMEPQDIWFTLPSSINDSLLISVETLPGSSFKYPIATLYDGSCRELTEIGCVNFHDPALISSSWISLPASVDQLYLRMFDAFHGKGSVRVSVCQRKPMAVSAQSEKDNQYMLIYPNPNMWNHPVQIRLTQPVAAPFKVSLVNMHAQLVEEITIYETGLPGSTFSLNLLTHPPGLYFVQLRSQKGVFNQKLLLLD